MAKSKKRGPAQKSKSSYAQELQIKKQLGANIIADWTAQLCLDTMAIVLNDPEVMGHSALGSKRLMRVCEAFNEPGARAHLRPRLSSLARALFLLGRARHLLRRKEHGSIDKEDAAWLGACCAVRTWGPSGGARTV